MFSNSSQLPKIKRLIAKKANLVEFPQNPGVYIFWDEAKPLYIGKAINLRKRLMSYYLTALAKKTKSMVESAKYISTITVASEIEALLLEAEMVWKYQPVFNSALKDDKHPLYIMITHEKYPRVLMAKRVDLTTPHKKIYGPFPSTSNMRKVLLMLRPIFPYSDHKIGKKGCLYSQMGLCNPCPSEIESTKDAKIKKLLKVRFDQNLKNIIGVLSGKIKKIRKDLERQMRAFAKDQRYEEARETRKKIERFDYVTRPVTSPERFLENPNLIDDIRNQETKALLNLLKKYLDVNKLNRIECFDVAHLAGSSPTASMVTFINGEAEKTLYRRFRIRQRKGADDISSLEEVAQRREAQLTDWGKPDLIIVDGGKGQVSTFQEQFKKHKIPVVGLAKRFETIVIPQKDRFILFRPTGKALSLVQRLRDEAHRFARSYHHKLISRQLLKTN